jgi:hypothetical protein
MIVPTGEQKKRDVLATLEAVRKTIVEQGRRALLLKLLQSPTATSDDVRDVVKLPPGIGPSCFGSVPGKLARAGIIRQAGFVKSTRPERHANYVMRWELADHDAAIAWLRLHPDLSMDYHGEQKTLFGYGAE